MKNQIPIDKPRKKLAINQFTASAPQSKGLKVKVGPLVDRKGPFNAPKWVSGPKISISQDLVMEAQK
jgi:hypothetical protein